MPTNRLRPYLDLISTVAIVATSVALIWANWDRLSPPLPETLPAGSVALGGAAVKGSSTAPVAIVIFTDYQCPYCRRFELEVLPQLVRDYVEPGKALLAVRHLPLTRIHPVAFKAASAAVCAGVAGKFWQLHELLFRYQAQLTDDKVMDLAHSLQLDTPEFERCVDESGSAQVTHDLESSRRLGLSSTPAVLIGRSRSDGSVELTSLVRGARPPEHFVKAVEAASKSNGSLFMLFGASTATVMVASVVVMLMTRRRRQGLVRLHPQSVDSTLDLPRMEQAGSLIRTVQRRRR